MADATFLIFSNNMGEPIGKHIQRLFKHLNAIDFRWTKSIIDNRCCAMWISYYVAEQGGKENAAQV